MTVFSFPMKSPTGAITRNKISAIEHLTLWDTYATYWCEHKPSMTCYYNDDNFYCKCKRKGVAKCGKFCL